MQSSFLGGEGGSELEHIGDKGQSPQEQPKDVSPHEYADTFISSNPDDSGMLNLNLMAYGEPGNPGGAFWPIKANHSGKNIIKQMAENLEKPNNFSVQTGITMTILQEKMNS